MAQTLAKRTVGKTGIQVSAVGLGCMSFSGTYGPSDDAASIALIHDAIEAGITLFDSSDAYGKGHNETLLGNALKGKRAGVVGALSVALRRLHDDVFGVAELAAALPLPTPRSLRQ